MWWTGISSTEGEGKGQGGKASFWFMVTNAGKLRQFRASRLWNVITTKLTPPSVVQVPEVGDESDVGVVQVLPILSRELVDEDFDSSLRFSLDSRLFDSSFSTCLKKKKGLVKHKIKFSKKRLFWSRCGP